MCGGGGRGTGSRGPGLFRVPQDGTESVKGPRAGAEFGSCFEGSGDSLF